MTRNSSDESITIEEVRRSGRATLTVAEAAILLGGRGKRQVYDGCRRKQFTPGKRDSGVYGGIITKGNESPPTSKVFANRPFDIPRAAYEISGRLIAVVRINIVSPIGGG